MIDVKQKKNIVETYGKQERNTGCESVQVALLTHNINALQKHFSVHKKDNHSRTGLLRMVGRRRRILDYLKSKRRTEYKDLIGSLNLRR